MAQDPERDEEQVDEINPSHELDMVPLYTSQTAIADVEAEVIRGILDSNGFPSILVRATGYPPLGYEIQVPRGVLEAARQVVEEQRKLGPEGAAEAEAAGEEEAG
jgi:hypothetical protein